MLARIGLFSIAAIIFAQAPGTPVSPRVAYATYVEKGAGSVSFSLAVDSAGYAYVAGGGPLTGGPRCAFLTKLNQNGTAAVWSVCLPMYQVNAIALDATGNIVVAGDNQPFLSGLVIASTVMKLSPDAQQVVYSTVIPGAGVAKLALDHNG